MLYPIKIPLKHGNIFRIIDINFFEGTTSHRNFEIRLGRLTLTKTIDKTRGTVEVQIRNGDIDKTSDFIRKVTDFIFFLTELVMIFQ